MTLSETLRMQLMDIAVRYGRSNRDYSSTVLGDTERAYDQILGAVTEEKLRSDLTEEAHLDLLNMGLRLGSVSCRTAAGPQVIASAITCYRRLVSAVVSANPERPDIVVNSPIDNSSGVIKETIRTGARVILSQHFGDLHDHGCPLRFLLDAFEVVHSSSPSDGTSAADSSSDPRDETVSPKAESCPHCGRE